MTTPLDPGLADRLLASTLELVNIPSVSGDEAALLDLLVALVPEEGFRLVDDLDGVRYFRPARRRVDAPLVVLAGHVDTVPPNGNLPGDRRGDVVIGRGACDMKGSIAVAMEVARWIASSPRASDLDVALLFFGREELPFTESALMPFLARCPEILDTALAVVMEPTSNAIEVGCMGNLNARVTIRGRAAHSARPWLGANAIHASIDVLSAIAGVEPDGMRYREVMGATRIAGGLASNVVPDLVTIDVNYRYAPSRSADDAERALRDLIPGEGQLEVVANAPSGPVATTNELVDRLRRAGDLALGPKQAWTPVAELATAGIDAVNFGPGDGGYAHGDDERIDAAALVRSHRVLRAFLEGGVAAPEDRPS
jgi:succinyl-diaminopimelate desuccinylase